MQFLWHTFHARYHIVDFASHAPEEFLDLCPGLEVDHAVAEELEHLVAYLLGIVP